MCDQTADTLLIWSYYQSTPLRTAPLIHSHAAALKDKVALEATVPQQLREYQRGAVETVWANNSINYIVVAPTGSGKTAIFVELARWEPHQTYLDSFCTEVG